MDLLENIPLAQYTTLGVGGPARWFVDANSDFDVLEALRFARAHSRPCFILGGGSNLLVSDDGFPGLVLRMANDAVAIQELREDGIAFVEANAGAEWDAVVRLAVENSAAGIECLAGIPGSVGGTPVQNVGAYGQEVARTIYQVHAVDLATDRRTQLSQGDCGFAYRRSIFNTAQQGRYVITHVQYRLKLDQPPHLEYRDVKHYFAERALAHPTLAETADAVRSIRASKGMLLAPDDPDSRSAGSFFKNPVVPAAKVPGLAAIAGCHPDVIPQFPAGADDAPANAPTRAMVKLSAAWLIELAGFQKGFTLGRVGLSTKHVLAIVNRGGATASEIIALRDAIHTAVFSRTAIRLEQEPVTLGFPPANPGP